MEGASNSLGAKAAPFISRIESVKAEIESLTGEHMQRCKSKREEIADIYVEAKNAGIATKPLKVMVKERALDRKKAKLVESLDLDESAIYRELKDTLGPLGAAAAQRAGYEDGEDLRPPFMRDAEKAKAHERGLETVGRGPNAA